MTAYEFGYTFITKLANKGDELEIDQDGDGKLDKGDEFKLKMLGKKDQPSKADREDLSDVPPQLRPSVKKEQEKAEKKSSWRNDMYAILRG